MMNSTLRHARVAALVSLTALLPLIGCGGGGGGQATQIGGQVRVEAYGATSTKATSPINVQAYVWPNLTTPVVQATADTAGRFLMTMPSETVGKDIVVLSTQTETANTAARTGGRVAPSTLRCSRIVADLQPFGKTEADLDEATTVASEAAIAKAKTIEGADLHSSAYGTLVTGVRDMPDILGMDMLADGTELPANFGDGLKSTGKCSAYMQTDDTCSKALALVAEAGNSDVKKARRIAQMMRDFGDGVVGPLTSEAGNLLWTAIEQQWIFEDEGQISGVFTERLRIVLRLMSITNDSSLESLKGKTQGQYEIRAGNPGFAPARVLVRTGNAPDGKSWIVVDKIAGNDLNTTVTITPTFALATFDFTAKAGGYALTVRKTDDATVKVDGTLNTTSQNNGTPTTVVGDLTIQDKELKSPVNAHGTFTGVPASGSTQDDPTYTSVSFSGSLSSQVANATVENATVTWYTSSAAHDFKSVQLTNLHAVTPFSKPITLQINSAVIDFEAPDPTHGYPSSTPKHGAFDGSIDIAGNKLAIQNGDMTFVRTATVGGIGSFVVNVLPATIKGTATYTSPVLNYVGTLDAKWDNPQASISGTTAASRFPIGKIHYTGDLKPVVGSPSYVDLILDSAVSGADVNNGKINVTLTLNRIAYPNVDGGEVLTGSVTAALTTASGAIQKNPTVTANVRHQPTGFALTVQSTDGAPVTGTIMNGTTKLADVGEASALGMPDLGSTVIIKYVDGTFETAVSILPYTNLGAFLQ